eukprot:CAMPEP_0181125122 /NCGR_PEP_ID=MMETSP1071-20121207/26866_1 /TAXON_ID=35127 /ORGANISM="Thalassiosira sp., Strain NH16" /LENGTH=801 /DNA_ID=CAMNT_0023210513 /DNA_START=71 /DNA_END=2476 /DNA_ORIENTATION=-
MARAKREKQQAVAGAIRRGQVFHDRALHHYKQRAEYELERVSTKADVKIEYYRMELKSMESKIKAESQQNKDLCAQVEQLRRDMQRQEEHGDRHLLDMVQEEIVNRELEKAHRDQEREELKSKRLEADLEAESEQNRNLKSQIIQLLVDMDDKNNDGEIRRVKEEAERISMARTEELKASEDRLLHASKQNTDLQFQVDHLTKEIQSAVARQESLNEEVQRVKEEADARETIAKEKGELEDRLANASRQNGVLKEQVAKLTTDICNIQMIAQKTRDAQDNKLKRMELFIEGLKTGAINQEKKLGDSDTLQNRKIDLPHPTLDIKSPHSTQDAVEVEYFRADKHPGDVDILSGRGFAKAGPAYTDASPGGKKTACAMIALPDDNSIHATSTTSLTNSASTAVKVEKGKIAWFRKLMANSFSEADTDDNSRIASTLSCSVVTNNATSENDTMVDDGCGSITTIEGEVRSRSKHSLTSRNGRRTPGSGSITVATADDESPRSDRSEATSLSQSEPSMSSSSGRPTELVVQFRSKNPTPMSIDIDRGTPKESTKEDQFRNPHTANSKHVTTEGVNDAPTPCPESVDKYIGGEVAPTSLAVTLETIDITGLPENTKEDRYRNRQSANDEHRAIKDANIDIDSCSESFGCNSVGYTRREAFATTISKETSGTHSNNAFSSKDSRDMADSKLSSCGSTTLVSSRENTSASVSLSESGYVSPATSTVETCGRERSTSDEGSIPMDWTRSHSDIDLIDATNPSSVESETDCLASIKLTSSDKECSDEANWFSGDASPLTRISSGFASCGQ